MVSAFARVNLSARVQGWVPDTFSEIRPMTSKYFDKEATLLTALDRGELTRRIRNFKGRFKLDFDEDYLNSLSLDRLRHILLAALINAKPHN